MPLKKPSPLSSLLLASVVVALSMPAHAQVNLPNASMKASVGDSYGSQKSTGTLTLSSSGAGFESSDFVLNVPTDEIQAVEFHGARNGFLTLVLDPHSKFLTAYPTLVSQRSNSIGEQEHLLILSLDPSEPVNTELARAKAFQAYVANQRAAREQAAVGAPGGDAASSTAHPSFGKTLHVVLVSPSSGNRSEGLLTFFPDRLQFISPDVTITFPLDQVVGLDPAGARETFLLLHFNPRSKLTLAYQKYEVGYQTGNFQFVLAPQDAIAPALKLAQDYAQYAEAIRSGQEQALVNGGAPAIGGGAAGAAPVASAALPSSEDQKREMARYEAGFLERHNPGSRLLNGFKAINGIPGTLIVFDTGLGYVSTAENPNVKPQRQQFEQSGYLKFFAPDSAILGIHDVSVIRNANSDTANSYIAEVDLDRNSSFFQQHKLLMAESEQDNRLFFSFKSRYMLQQFLANASRRSGGARDSF